jgi:hypothetical protein
MSLVSTHESTSILHFNESLEVQLYDILTLGLLNDSSGTAETNISEPFVVNSSLLSECNFTQSSVTK